MNNNWICTRWEHTIPGDPANDHEPRIYDKPFFTNGCPHKGFCGAVIFLNEAGIEERLDVYLFENGLNQNQSCCMRYGSAAHEYISPGTALDVFFTAAVPGSQAVYRAAAFVLDSKFKFRAVVEKTI